MGGGWLREIKKTRELGRRVLDLHREVNQTNRKSILEKCIDLPVGDMSD
jgi:hypothetical protein